MRVVAAEMRTRSEIGAALMAAREAAGISRDDVGEKIGRGYTGVKAIEEGRAGSPIEVYADFAAAVGLELNVELAGTAARGPALPPEAARLRELALMASPEDLRLAIRMLERALDLDARRSAS